MTYCLNCGHDSHCGTTLKKDLSGDGEEIEVCKYCRCKLCSNIPVEEPWPGPGV